MIKDPRRKKELQKFVQKLGLIDLSKIDWDNLDLALTHCSFSATDNYEKLEFIGDSVIRLVSAEILMENYVEEPVGEFAALRSIMVSDRTLSEFADIFGLEQYLLQSDQATEDKAGRISKLADSFEALLGALYLSTHNMDLIRPWLDEILIKKADEIYQDPARQNYKDALQEWTQGNHKCLPTYQVQEIQPMIDTEERFMAEVWLKDQKLGIGKGRSKKAAEQAAAKEAFFSVKELK